MSPAVENVNDCGSRDIYPVLAKISTWGYGPTGTWGIGTTGVRDRYHFIDHSGYFNAEFVNKHWAPFLKDGTIVEPEYEIRRPPVPQWMSWLSLVPLRWLWLTPIIFGFYLIAQEIGYKPLKANPIVSLAVGHIVGEPVVFPILTFDYVEKVGFRSKKIYVRNARLIDPNGKPIAMDLEGYFVSWNRRPEVFAPTSTLDVVVVPYGVSTYRPRYINTDK
jgi:hypothetical protein